MKFKRTAGMLVAGTLLGVTAYSATNQPSQVQAKASYKIQITKNAYIYTSRGKKTRAIYKKNKVATAYRIRKIRGKYYYDLGHGKYVRTSYAKKYYYRTYKQSKTITRTIKLYQPKGMKYIYQNAYVKRTVKQSTRTGRKTYGKWGTAAWQTYTVPTVNGYTASPKSVASETVYSWTKNKTVKVKYKKNAKKAASKSTTPSKQSSSAKSQSGSKSSSKANNTTKREFTANLTNTSERNGQKVYEYHEYERDGNNFSLRGSGDTSLSVHQKVTVKDVAYDTKGNAYYYVTGLTDFGDDGTPYDNDYIWILASETDKPDKSHSNTLTVTPVAKFNVQQKVRTSNWDWYYLQDDKTLKLAGNWNGTYGPYEAPYGGKYKYVYTVDAEATDKKGVKYYELTTNEWGYKGIWVKASDFETTSAANTADPATRFQWTNTEKREFEQRDLATLNEFRKEVGVAPLTINTSIQAQTDERAENLVKYYANHGELDHHNGMFGFGENLFGTTWTGNNNEESPTWLFMQNEVAEVKADWNREKQIYQQPGYTQAAYGHYGAIINPEFTSVSISSAFYREGKTKYFVVVEEYWK